MRKLLLLAAFGIGYVLGARAGRERYEQIKDAAARVKNDPRVREKTHQAMGAAREVAREQAPVVADKVTSVAGAAAAKVTGSGSGADKPEPHHMAGPQGDLP